MLCPSLSEAAMSEPYISLLCYVRVIHQPAMLCTSHIYTCSAMYESYISLLFAHISPAMRVSYVSPALNGSIYAVSGTDLRPSHPTNSLLPSYGSPMRCPVLTWLCCYQDRGHRPQPSFLPHVGAF
eukprot:2661369-Rhodomonas_salina.1